MVGVVGYRTGERTEEDVRAILRHPGHMAGSDGIFAADILTPAAGGRSPGISATTPGNSAITTGPRPSLTFRPTPPAGSASRIEGCYGPAMPRTSPFSTRDRHRPLDLRRRPNPRRGGGPRGHQRDPRPRERRAHRGDARPGLAPRLMTSSETSITQAQFGFGCAKSQFPNWLRRAIGLIKIDVADRSFRTCFSTLSYSIARIYSCFSIDMAGPLGYT